MTALYKLADNYMEAVSSLAEMMDAGEIDAATMADTMEGLGGEIMDKAVNVALHIKNLRSDLAQLEAVKAEYDARAKSAKKALEFFEGYLDANMRKAGIDSVKNQYVEVKYKKLPPIVDITGDVPEAFLRVIPEKREPDKAAIKKALQDGASLPFADLLTGREALVIK